MGRCGEEYILLHHNNFLQTSNKIGETSYYFKSSWAVTSFEKYGRIPSAQVLQVQSLLISRGIHLSSVLISLSPENVKRTILLSREEMLSSTVASYANIFINMIRYTRRGLVDSSVSR